MLNIEIQKKEHDTHKEIFLALEKLGYGDFRKDAEDALAECKEVAAKRKKQNNRLENLGISQEELRQASLVQYIAAWRS